VARETPGFIGFFARRNELAEREGLSGGLIRSPYISEKNCDSRRVTGYFVDYSADYFCLAQSTGAKIATISQVHNLKTGSKHSWLKALAGMN
jgi:hypothetical protein